MFDEENVPLDAHRLCDQHSYAASQVNFFTWIKLSLKNLHQGHLARVCQDVSLDVCPRLWRWIGDFHGKNLGNLGPTKFGLKIVPCF